MWLEKSTEEKEIGQKNLSFISLINIDKNMMVMSKR